MDNRISIITLAKSVWGRSKQGQFTRVPSDLVMSVCDVLHGEEKHKGVVLAGGDELMVYFGDKR